MSDEFVTVETYPRLPEATAAQLLLESEGISTFLADAETIAMDWLLANAVGGIKLQVPPADVDRATVLIRKMNFRSVVRAGEPDDAQDESLCLACGKDMPEDAERCSGCGWSYADASEE